MYFSRLPTTQVVSVFVNEPVDVIETLFEPVVSFPDVKASVPLTVTLLFDKKAPLGLLMVKLLMLVISVPNDPPKYDLVLPSFLTNS